MNYAIGFLVLALITSLHAYLVYTSATELSKWVFWVFPVLFTMKATRYLFVQGTRISVIRWVMMVWSVLALIWNVVFLRYTMTESIFVMMVLYLILVEENKAANTFRWSIWAFGCLILNLFIGDFNFFTVHYLEAQGGVYSQPSGSLMLLGSGVLFYMANKLHHDKQLSIQEQAAEDHIKAHAIKNMLLSLGHTIRTPLTALRMKMETLALRYPELAQDKNLSNQYIDVIINQMEFLTERLDDSSASQSVAEWGRKLQDEFNIEIKFISTESKHRDFSQSLLTFHYAIAHILLSNAFQHGSGEVNMTAGVFDRKLEYTIENSGVFFNPVDFVDNMGAFTPEMGTNNRIGSSLLICYSLAEAMKYHIQYTRSKSGGTKVLVGPIGN